MSEPTPRILVVEDEAEIRRFVSQSLERDGFEVYQAETLQRGLIEAGTRRPDLLVLDLGLPDGDGVDLIRDLRTWSNMMRAACRLTSGAPQYTLGHDSDSTDTSMPTVSIIRMRAG